MKCAVAVAARVVHVNEARVRERRRRSGLGQEALGEGGILGERRREDLDRDVPLEPDVAGPIDARHPAARDGGLDPISVAQRRADHRIGRLRLPARLVAHRSAAAAISAVAARTPSMRAERRGEPLERRRRQRGSSLADGDAQGAVRGGRIVGERARTPLRPRLAAAASPARVRRHDLLHGRDHRIRRRRSTPAASPVRPPRPRRGSWSSRARVTSSSAASRSPRSSAASAASRVSGRPAARRRRSKNASAAGRGGSELGADRRQLADGDRLAPTARGRGRGRCARRSGWRPRGEPSRQPRRQHRWSRPASTSSEPGGSSALSTAAAALRASSSPGWMAARSVSSASVATCARSRTSRSAAMPAAGSASRGPIRTTRPSERAPPTESGGSGAYHGAVISVDALRPLPKAELHQHLDGSVRPATAVELAAAIGMPLDLDEARRRMVGPERCADQAELLTFFDLPIALLQTAEALERVTAELVEDLIADGVRYAEIRWAPRLHLDARPVRGRGHRGGRVGHRTRRARRMVRPCRSSASSSTAMRSASAGANVELARVAAAFGPPIIGFDLAGPEAAWPAPPHAAAFNAAREGGLALTAHAGEVAGPHARARGARPRRQPRGPRGHGARGRRPRPAPARARRHARPVPDLERAGRASCRTWRAIRSRRSIGPGVSVTLSTDDRTVTGTTLTEELFATAEAVGLNADELTAIALNGFRRAFAPPVVMQPIFAAATRAWDAWWSGQTIT